MFPIAFINSLSIIVSLSTLMGIVVHDTYADKAALTAFTGQAVHASVDTGTKSLVLNDPHTHTERRSFSQSLNELKGEAPRTQVRMTDDRKYVLHKKTIKHHHSLSQHTFVLS